MKRFFGDVIKYYNYAVRSAKTSLKTEVANSYLNWIWWIFDPMFNAIIYYVIFGVLFQQDKIVQYFVAFLFLGLTMWDFFNKNLIQSVNMIKRNKSIVSKVYIPKFILLISNMMVNGFKMMISWVILLIIMIIYRVPITFNMLWVIPIMMLVILVTFGFCVNLMHFGVFVEDLSNVMNIVLKLTFYITGIFFNLQDKLLEAFSKNNIAPEKAELWAKVAVFVNPMAMAIRDMRNTLLYGGWISWRGVLLWATIGIVLSAIGVHTIYKNENSYVKVI